MLVAALPELEILTRARLVTVSEVVGDEVAARLPWVCVGVMWPDGSMWVVPVNGNGAFWRDDLLDGYRKGRDALERMLVRILEPVGHA